MFPIFFATYGAVFVAEIVGDKLLYTTGVLAARYRTVPIMFGMSLAFMLKMGVAVAVGEAISKLPPWLVATVTALPGEVYCDNKMICRFAGKPFAVDEFVLEQMIATGAATKQQVADMLKARGITSFSTAPTTSEYVVTQAATHAKAPD